MIHSARPTVSPVENIVFTWNFVLKIGDGRTHVRMDVQTDDMWEKQWSLPAMTLGWPCGSTTITVAECDEGKRPRKQNSWAFMGNKTLFGLIFKVTDGNEYDRVIGLLDIKNFYAAFLMPFFRFRKAPAFWYLEGCISC